MAAECEPEAKAMFAVAYCKQRDAGANQLDAAAAAAQLTVHGLEKRISELLEADDGVRLKQLVTLDL